MSSRRLADTLSQQPDVAANDAAQLPPQIGRYRIEKVLGQGGCGKVYLGHDDVLKRRVAIKVSHRHLVSSPEHIEHYLAEARVLASLDHPNIVPVHDAGKTEDGLCYVVSKFIEGTNVTARISSSPLSQREAAELVATVAEALNHAHLHRVVHRDIKPSNILLDPSGKPYLADFGLALTDEHFGEGWGQWADTMRFWDASWLFFWLCLAGAAMKAMGLCGQVPWCRTWQQRKRPMPPRSSKSYLGIVAGPSRLFAVSSNPPTTPNRSFTQAWRSCLRMPVKQSTCTSGSSRQQRAKCL